MSETGSSPTRLLILGAHPDDAEYSAGGLAALYRSLGHVVRMVSATNGEAGHHKIYGPKLVERRKLEAADQGPAVIGAEHEVGAERDGRLWNTEELRERLIRAIRLFSPGSRSQPSSAGLPPRSPGPWSGRRLTRPIY